MPPVTLLRRSYIVDDETESQGKTSDTADNDVSVTRLLCMTWSFHDPALHESCIVALYLLRSLYVPLGDMNSAKTTSDSNTTSDDGSCGVEWELIYLPQSEDVACKGHTACRTAFRFVGASVDRSTREGLSGVVFLSARSVCLYTGSTDPQGECALDLFTLTHHNSTNNNKNAMSRWQRSVAALVLPSNRPRTADHTRNEMRLLHVSAMPSVSALSHTTNVIYALATPSATLTNSSSTTLYDIVFGVVAVHYESETHSVSWQLKHILTDHSVRLVFPPPQLLKPQSVPNTKEAAMNGNDDTVIAPWQCRWLFVPDVRAIHPAEPDKVAGVLLGQVDMHESRLHSDNNSGIRRRHTWRVHCAGFRADEAEPVLGLSAEHRSLHHDNMDDASEDAEEEEVWQDTHSADQHSHVTFLSIGAPTTRLAVDATHTAISEMDKAHTTTQADINIETSTPQMWVLRLVCDFLQPAQGTTGATTTVLPPVQGLCLTSTSLDQLASYASFAQAGYDNTIISANIVNVSNSHTRWCGLLPIQLPLHAMRDHTAGSDMKTLSLVIRNGEVVEGMSPRQQDYTPASPCTPLRLLFVDTCDANGDAERQTQAVCCCAFATQPAPLTHTATLYVAQMTCATLLLSSSSLTRATEEDTNSEADMLLCRSPYLITPPTRNAGGMKEMVEWLARVALRSATSDKAEVVAHRVVQLLWQGCLALAEADVTTAVATLTQTVQHELPWRAYTAAQATHASLDDYSDAVWTHIGTIMASGTKDTLYQWAVHTWHACFLQLMQHDDWLAVTVAEQCVLRQLILCYLGLMSHSNDTDNETSEAVWLCMHVLLRVTAHEALDDITSTQGVTSQYTELVNDNETLQWLRRMLLLYASRRCDATLELLLEDLCTTAATAQYNVESHMTHTRAMMEGMEYALLSSVDEATLYDALHALARSELPLSDLHILCCHWHYETLRGVAETTLPSLPLLPFLVDIAYVLIADKERVNTESMIVQLLSQYEGYCNEKDACDENAECSASAHPLCLPAFLLRDGVPWTELSRFPFSTLSAEACILVFFHVIERWARYVEVKQVTPTIPINKEEVSVSEHVACALWERYAAQCQRLREAVHVWRWMSGIDTHTVSYEECSPAELLVRGMRMWHLYGMSQCEIEGTHALTDFAVLLHLRPCAFLADNPVEEDSDNEEDNVVVVQRLMRFVHCVFACATSCLLASLAQRSVTEEVQQDAEDGADAICVLQKQLARLYNAAQGLSGSAEEEGKPATAHDISRRVLCALWEHLWYDDAEAITNAVLYDKLLETAATLQTKSTSRSSGSAASLLMALMRPICLYCYPVLMQTSNNRRSEDEEEEEDKADDMTLYKQYDDLTFCTNNEVNDDDGVPRCSLAEVRVKAMSAVLRSLALFESNGSEANTTTAAAMSLRCLRRLLALVPATNTEPRVMPHPRSASSVSTAPGSARVSRPPSTAPAATVTTRPTLSPRNTLQVSHHSARQGTELYGTERVEGNAAAHSTLQGWALSPVASYFVAMHGILSQADMTHMVLVAELLRRELSSFVLRALVQLRYVEADPNNQLDTVKYVATDRFEPREVLNTVAEGMEGGIDALRTCGGPLYEPLLLLFYLERMYSLCVAQSTTSDEVVEAKVHCEDAMREALQQCIGIIAQRTLAPLSAEVRHRLHYVLPEHFDAHYCSTSEPPATAVSLSEMSYEQSAVHQRMQAEVFATLQDLRSVVLPDGPDAELAHACGLNDVPSEITTHTAARGSADAEAGFVESGGNFLAHTLLSKLTEHIAPSPQSQALSHTQTTLTSSIGAGVEKTAERERDVNLLVKEEAVRRRQVQAATLQAYHDYVTTDRTFLNALATLYLAMRHERRRRELLSHVTEQKDLIFTFSMLWLRQLQEAQRQRGRQLALAAAEALQRQWRLVQREEREQRTAIEALAGAVRSLLVTQHAEQTQVWEREQQTRLALVQLEEQQREWMMSEASTVLPTLRPHVANKPLRVSPTPPYTSLTNINNTNEYDMAAQMSSAGLAYVNEAKDNLWNAFSKLHNKLRDTVAPAPPERTRRLPIISSNSALPSPPPQTVWSQPPPPTSAPVPQSGTSHAGWEWNDEEEAEEKLHDSHATEEKRPAEHVAVPPQSPVIPIMADKHEEKEEDKKKQVPQESSPSASVVPVVPVVRAPHTRPRRTTRRAPFATVLDTKAVQGVTEVHATATTTTEIAAEVAEVRTDESGKSVYDAIAEAVAADSTLEETSGALDTHRNEEQRCMLPRDVAERCATAETQARAELTAAEAQAWRVVRVDEVYASALIARRYALMH